MMNWYKKAKIEYNLEDPPLYGDSDYKQRGGKIVKMSPYEFLNKVNKQLIIDDESQENIDDLKNMILNNKKIDPPTLYYRSGEVINHDGRHRAIAAQQLGIKSIPVLIMES
jgi:hypothetical protein